MKIVLLLIVCLIALIILVYAWLGGFDKIPVSISEAGGETVVYEPITGDYRQSGVVMDKVYYTLLNNDKIETYKGFGTYFDNPEKVEKSKLRSEAGCVVEERDLEKLTALTNKYTIKILARKDYILATMPYKGKASVFVGIMKVYPALSKFATAHGFDNGGAVTEVYDIPNKKIYYRKEMSSKPD